MKKIIKIVCFILCLTLTFLTACGDKQSEKPDDRENKGNNKETVISYTDNYLLKDGISEYKIVKPVNASAKEDIAVDEMIDLFRLSTGFILPVVTDESVNYTSGSEFIFIGRTSFLERFGIVTDYKELGEQGFLIKNVDKSIVITGAVSNCYGTIYGVYEFLSKQVGFECYSEDEVFVYPSANLMLVDYKTFKDKPDIAFNTSQSNKSSTDTLFMLRNRFVSLATDLFVGRTTPYHSSFVYLSPDKYLNDHPKWYSDDHTQICYYAHNDKAEYEAMVDTLFNIFKEIVLEDENVKHIGFAMEDTVTWCNCDACSAMGSRKSIKEVNPDAYSDIASEELLLSLDKSGYGANAAGCLILMNRISEKFAQDEQIKDRELDFCFFAYNRTFSAPVTKNESGELIPTSSDVICRNNVYPFVCTFDMYRSMSINDKYNAAIKETIEGWSVLSEKIAFWTYTENYNDYLAPRDCITMLQDNYRYYKEKSPVFYKEESQGKNYNSTGFENLKIWLSYKLAWNVDADVNSLIKQYFEHYFKDAADSMFEYYTSYMLTVNKNRTLYNYSQQDNVNAVQERYYSYGVVTNWLNILNKAYEDIEYLKTEDPEIYRKLYDRICLEGITAKYTKLVAYKNTMSSVEFEKLKREIIADADRVNMVFFADNGSVTIEDKINGLVK